MKKFSKKGVLLFAGAMALCAFVLPSVASAASWGPANSTHTLDSGNTGFTSLIAGAPTSSSCSRSSFATSVTSGIDMRITAASFGGLCTITSAAVGDCTVTTQATGLPWTATAVTTSNLQIHGVDINITLEQLPVSGGCLAVGQRLRITGTLTGGTYLGAGSLSLNGGEGLTSHSAFGSNPVTTVGTLTDTNTAATRLTVS